MNQTEHFTFAPILTVLPEPGPAYIWVVRRPDQGGVGPNLCDLMGWSDSFPMSHGLWQKFSDWAVEFHRVYADSGYSGDMGDDWDWLGFHARGMLLSRWLKEEVGDSHRVVYYKAPEDPNHSLGERTEILADGTLKTLQPLGGWRSKSGGFCQHIVSGGQTGADRAALDFAIEHGYTHGGWAPSEREAEDGPIPLKYQLTVLPGSGYRQRTQRNVEDSDGTLIVNVGQLDGGTLATREFAEALGKPFLVVQLDAGTSMETAQTAVQWLRDEAIDTLNVAGPRESKRPGIYGMAVKLLAAMHDRTS